MYVSCHGCCGTGSISIDEVTEEDLGIDVDSILAFDWIPIGILVLYIFCIFVATQCNNVRKGQKCLCVRLFQICKNTVQ